MAQAIDVERYIWAFETYARVAAKEAEGMLPAITRVATYLRSRYRGEVEIETLCKDAVAWSSKQHIVLPPYGKSCLLSRLIYGGEELRTRPCPIHEGHWSGCTPHPCPGGCSFGMNVTGWLPNDHVDAWPALDEDPPLELLGRRVRERWSNDELAVYADRLLALGDPRGELITLELAMGSSPSAAQQVRYDALVAECFGDLRSTAPGEFRSTKGVGNRATVDRGFLSVEARDAQDMRKIYNARNGRYLRKLSIRGDGPSTRQTLAMVQLRPHVWLRRIMVFHDPIPHHPYTLEGDQARRLFAAAPNLNSIAFTGHRILAIDELPVRSLWMTELDTVAFDHAPELTHLILAIDRFASFEEVVDDFVRRAPKLESIHVPAAAVAGLDLSRIKPRVHPDVD